LPGKCFLPVLWVDVGNLKETETFTPLFSVWFQAWSPWQISVGWQQGGEWLELLGAWGLEGVPALPHHRTVTLLGRVLYPRGLRSCP
jgi:hypothetical protein